jgi:hypothetical protein
VARLYAAGYNAVGVVDDGKVQTVLDGRGAQCLAVDPKDPDTLYVGTSDEGLFRSTDGGGAERSSRASSIPGSRRSRSVPKPAGDGPGSRAMNETASTAC